MLTLRLIKYEVEVRFLNILDFIFSYPYKEYLSVNADNHIVCIFSMISSISLNQRIFVNRSHRNFIYFKT